MRIGVIGAGQMATALGRGWVKAGHEVLIGGRSTQRAADAAERIGPGTRHGDLRQAAQFGEVTLVAVSGTAVVDAVRQAGGEDGALAGRPLIDCSNAVAPTAFTGPAPGAFVLAEDAVAERIAGVAAGAHVVKAFNVCAAEIWAGADRRYEGRPLGVPLCGDDPDALRTVATLVADLGGEPVLAGGLDRARYLEGLAVFAMGLWFAGYDARAVLPATGSGSGAG